MTISFPFQKRITKWFRVLLPFLILTFLFLIVSKGISEASKETLLQEQKTLENALVQGAIHSYALEGKYPEDLNDLLQDYHITYDKEKFLVDYQSVASNLLPQIAVIPLDFSRKEAAS